MAALATFDPARKLTLYLRIGMDGSKTFTFSDNAGGQYDISGITFEMLIYDRVGASAAYLTWTEATELSKPDNYSLTVTYTDTVASGIRAHEYFYILTRTDGSGLKKVWLNGPLIAHEGEFDGITETTSISINDVGETINITINDTTLGVNHVTGPATATDRALAIFDGTTGKLIQNSTPTIDANGNLIIPFTNTGPYQGVTLANQSTANFSGGGFSISGAGVTAWLLGLFYAQQVNANNSRVRIDGVSNNAAALFLDIDGSLSNRAKFIGPVRIQEYATASLPAAATHPYSFAYDTTIGAFLFSNGTSWIGLTANSATALVDGASIALTATKHTLATSSATRTFTISYTGDDITIEVTLNATSSVFTFPATALCVSEGTASGDNTCTLSGVSGDKYIIAIKKVGSAYYVVCKNFGQ